MLRGPDGPQRRSKGHSGASSTTTNNCRKVTGRGRTLGKDVPPHVVAVGELKGALWQLHLVAEHLATQNGGQQQVAAKPVGRQRRRVLRYEVQVRVGGPRAAKGPHRLRAADVPTDFALLALEVRVLAGAAHRRGLRGAQRQVTGTGPPGRWSVEKTDSMSTKKAALSPACRRQQEECGREGS